MFVSNKLALLSKSTSSREIPRYINIAAAGVTQVQKVLREFIFAGVQSKTILFQNVSVTNMLLRLREGGDSKKYYEKRNTFHIGANKWFLTEGNILNLFAKAILTFVSCFSFPRCGYVMFLKLPLFVSLFVILFVIELKPAMVNSSVSSRISFTLKFMMLGLLIFKVFYDDNICSGYISERFKFGF